MTVQRWCGVGAIHARPSRWAAAVVAATRLLSSAVSSLTGGFRTIAALIRAAASPAGAAAVRPAAAARMRADRAAGQR